MNAVFVKLLNLSITASWLILAVLVLRFLLKKAPRWMTCVLWALVAVRLVCPFSWESALSLIPSSETIPGNIEWMESPAIDSGVAIIDDAVNPILADSFTPTPFGSANPLQIVIPVLSAVWIAGMLAMLIYALISYIVLLRSVGASVAVRDNILICDEVKSPFILGIFRPRIYVPSAIEGETLDCVIAHETAHIRRHDHWWKPLGYLLLTVYWFNPLCWVAYILLCRDIETACDEKVVRELDRDGKAAYSQALLNSSFPRRRIAVCPVAFGEVGVKERVRSVLNYKRPAFWILAAAAVVCIAAAVCFLTDPPDRQPDLSFLNYENACSLAADEERVRAVYYPPVGKDEDGAICVGSAQGVDVAKYLDLASWKACGAPRESLSSPGSIEFCVRDDYRITVYRKPGRAKVTCGDETRYYRTRIGDYDKAVALFGTETIESAVEKWFDCLHGDPMVWEGYREFDLEEFPDMTLRWYYDRLEAVDGRNAEILLRGMPIWSVYFCDLNGDGKREICSTYSIGSGIVDNRFVIYDYANGASYEKSDRMDFDYTLHTQNGKLIVEKRPCMQDELLDSGELVFRDDSYRILWDSELESPADDSEAMTWDLIPMVMAQDGQLYLDTGHDSDLAWTDDGDTYVIESEVSGSLKPTEKNQSNFGKGFSYRFAQDGVIEVKMDDVLRIFATEEKRREIQFGTQDADEIIGAKVPPIGYSSATAFAGLSVNIRLYTEMENAERLEMDHICALPTYRFESLPDFEVFRDTFTKDMEPEHGYEEMPSFDKAAEKYDEDYFRDHALVLSYVEAESASYRYDVQNVSRKDETFSVNIEQINQPDVCKNYPACWFVFVEIEKSEIDSCRYFVSQLV